jgi:hypothetical protein
MELRFEPIEEKQEEPLKEFIFFSDRMIEEMNKEVMKKGLEQEFVLRARHGMRTKALIW